MENTNQEKPKKAKKVIRKLIPIEKGTNPDAIPNEVYATHLQLDTIKELLTNEDYLRFEQLLNFRKEIALGYLIQLFNGCRINEVLKLKWSDNFMNIGFISEGSKGSNPRLLICPCAENLLKFNQDKKTNVLIGVNYNIIHRIYLKYGIWRSQGKDSNKIVTHLHRYNYIQNLKLKNTSTEAIKNIVGHKVTKTTEHYLNKLAALPKLNKLL